MTAVQTTRDELSLIKSYLLLTHILKVFENDAKRLKSEATVHTSPLYIEMIRSASQCAAVLLSGIRREFKKRHIRICEVKHGEAGVDTDYLCRGLHGTMHIDSESFRSETDLRMRAYMSLQTEPIVTDSGRQSASPTRTYPQRPSAAAPSKKKLSGSYA
ncbi:hypothetical protein CDO73_23540 [Saccharibacillus sp. O23]|uniref:hypothetical protein n=1 Tax=Saccharibacillus sp. O23 TaxID=2009338 RepID=UPI000B4E71ED|nr:hypothetical protein [Saccharibacillus sp. O23]OWR27221.1 hypothetical protein CDO73_23540 [Saccharibacillus sp. O23]